MLYCFVACPDWAIELRERHRLLSDILKLAKELEVQFAFPTRTLHLFSEQADSPPPDLTTPSDTGRQVAEKIIGTDERQMPGPVQF